MMRGHALTLLIAVAALTASTALAEDSAISTANADAPTLSTSQQIAAYLAHSPTTTLDHGAAPGAISSTSSDGLKRQVHGEVSVAVGTNGFRSAYARADMPIGESGRLSVAIQDSRGETRFGPRGARSLGLGFALGDSVANRRDARCQDSRLDRFEAPTDEDLNCRNATRRAPYL